MSQQTIHFVLQGKGGVGKSYVASHLAQFLQEKHSPQNCIFYDADPVNPTFKSLLALNVNQLDILSDSNVIDVQKFDELLNALLDDKMQAKQIVIDVGAGTFLPLISYLKENDIVDLIEKNGVKTFFHVILAGGQPFNETVTGLRFIADELGVYLNTVIWLNSYFGNITEENRTTLQGFLNKNPNSLLVDIPLKNRDLFGRDIDKMTVQNLTYKQVAKSESPDFQMMTKRRLDMYKTEIFNQLAELEVL
jgi:hypothetical protein